MMRDDMRHDEDEMDRIFSGEDEIQPSSGFAASVMEGVQREAVGPPPIPFPWMRALPGLVVAGLAVVLVVMAAVVAGGQVEAATVHRPSMSMSWLSLLLSSPLVFQGNVGSAAIWGVLAVGVTFVSVNLSMRLASGRG